MRAPSSSPSSRYRFGRCEIDAGKRTLTRRARVVEVEPRVFDLLLHLIEQHHRVVAVSELLDAVWSGVEVTAGSVSQAVHKARLAIGDDGGKQGSIATVRSRGFRFVAPLVVDGDAPIDRRGEGFVGRAFELARVERALARAQRGRGGLVYLAGEPGIGKTHTVEEIVARVPARRMEAHLAHCPEGEELPAFWPWRELARKLASRRTPAEIEWLGSEWASDFLGAELQVSGGFPRKGDSARIDRQTLMRRFASATDGLARLARERPLLLALEDMHRADFPSLLFLRFLAHSLPELSILVVATFRDGELAPNERRARLLADARRAAGGEVLTLAALSPDETLLLAEKQLGRPLTESLLDALCSLSGGNPFLLGELVRLVERGDAGDRAAGRTLPPTVRAAVKAQLGRLGAKERRILTMAAVLGVEFELAPLATAAGVAPEKVHRALVAAGAVHVVTPVEGKTHAFRFVHALVREALYEDLGPRERAHHHLRAARALEASSRAGPGLLAYHFCEAATIGGAERGVQAACQAARVSAERLDFERASREFEQALRCLDFVPGSSPRRRCEILVEAALAASHTNPRRGGLLLLESARLARRLGDSAQALLVSIEAAAAQIDVDAFGVAAALAETLGPASSAIDVVLPTQTEKP